MHFMQYYLACLSQASYLIGDTRSGRAAVVDPRRDIDEYVDDARDVGLSIDFVIETHFHADFLSGHRELAAATGAEIVFSSVAAPEFPFRAVADGERIALGDVVLEFRHTPGHTPESMSIVVWESADAEVPYGVLTGDTMFIGDVGRPDLLSANGISRDELAAQLYDSLHEKLLVLPDATRVFPAHGAGSACGKNLSTETSSTIGEQRTSNYALLAPDRSSFIDLVTEGQPPAPGYFAYDAMLNRTDHALLDGTAEPDALDLAEVTGLVDDGAVVIDGRRPEEFAHGHLVGSINVGLEGRFAEFAGSVLPTDVDIVLVVEPGFEREAKNRLARIGFDRVVGYLAEPYRTLAEHPERAQRASRLTVQELDGRDDVSEIQLVDVRNPGEYRLGTINGAPNVPVGQLRERVDELDRSAATVLFCAGGYRSSVAASLLRAAGFTDVSDVIGGYNAWTELQRAAVSDT